jgi:ribonucleoside-diphosphate reductase alpha chain
MDIVVDKGGYPTELIARNSHDFRPLGLGYANLGALLLHMGLPYDSDEGRNIAAALTAIMCGEAYLTSASLAMNLARIEPAGSFTKSVLAGATTTTGAFPGFADNEKSFREVMVRHHEAAKDLYARFDSPLAEVAENIWSFVANPRDTWAGFRNSQVTVLAPTGTIGFMMDCDTTGIEPMLAIVAFKKLVGGGSMKLVVKGVPNALKALGYTPDQVKAINDYVTEHGTVEGAPELRKEHLPVFDSAFTPKNGKRSISWRGHVAMMAATQPFLSGAISKTVNLPHEATVDDIEAAYVESWKLGLKAVAIYRDGSKGGQPMAAASKDGEKKKEEEKPAVVAAAPVNQPDLNGPPVATRHRLPKERASVTHKFNIGMYEGYITVGLFPNGKPGEIFIRMAKEGSTISGLMDSFAMLFSLSLQHGVSLKDITNKLKNTSFEPSGFTGTEELGRVSSIMDYIGRWMDIRFGEGRQLSLFNNHAQQVVGVTVPAVAPAPVVPAEEERSLTELVKSSRHIAEEDVNYGDAPMCASCGGHMKQSGKCHTCLTCGTTSGGCS